MFIHAVYFWLRDDLTSREEQQFNAGLESLRKIDTVDHGYIGSPAPTDRPVIERGYSRALVLIFANQRDHDSYQTHPVHDRFRDTCSTLWKSVRIYDSVEARDAR
jgi:hypothetical protein